MLVRGAAETGKRAAVDRKAKAVRPKDSLLVSSFNFTTNLFWPHLEINVNSNAYVMILCKMSLFPDYLDKPTNITFKEQEEDEVIQLLLRRDWITNLPWVFASLIGYFIPIVALKDNLLTANQPIFSQPAIGAITILWYVALLGFVLLNFLSWYFNIYIITDRHIVQISFASALSTSVTSSEITDVQATHYSFQGIFGSLFHYGDVVLETASKGEPLLFSKVPNPEMVIDRIDDLEQNIETAKGPVA